MPDSETKHLDDSAALNHAWQIYRNVQELIRYADQKVHVSLALSAVVTTFALANLPQAKDAGRVALTMLVLLGVAQAAFLAFALGALFARRDARTGGAVRRLVYFGHIVRFKEPAEYVREFRSVTPAEAVDDVAYQIYEVSCIAGKKFANYRRAWCALVVEIVLLVALAIALEF